MHAYALCVHGLAFADVCACCQQIDPFKVDIGPCHDCVGVSEFCMQPMDAGPLRTACWSAERSQCRTKDVMKENHIPYRSNLSAGTVMQISQSGRYVCARCPCIGVGYPSLCNTNDVAALSDQKLLGPALACRAFTSRHRAVTCPYPKTQQHAPARQRALKGCINSARQTE